MRSGAPRQPWQRRPEHGSSGPRSRAAMQPNQPRRASTLQGDDGALPEPPAQAAQPGAGAVRMICSSRHRPAPLEPASIDRDRAASIKRICARAFHAAGLRRPRGFQAVIMKAGPRPMPAQYAIQRGVSVANPYLHAGHEIWRGTVGDQCSCERVRNRRAAV